MFRAHTARTEQGCRSADDTDYGKYEAISQEEPAKLALVFGDSKRQDRTEQENRGDSCYRDIEAFVHLSITPQPWLVRCSKCPGLWVARSVTTVMEQLATSSVSAMARGGRPAASCK